MNAKRGSRHLKGNQRNEMEGVQMTDHVLPIPYGYTEGWQGSDAYQARQAM